MANYYKLSNGSSTELVCEASLSKSMASMLLFCKKVSVEKVSQEQYLDYKAQEYIDTHKVTYVEDMFTKSGLPVICVLFAPVDDDDALCHYIVVENGYKRLMMTYQKNLYEGDI